MQITAAKEWGYQPTSLILRDLEPGDTVIEDAQSKRGQPSRWDLLLAEAEVVVEAERCGQCGRPRYICQSEDEDIAFEVIEEECHATQARMRAEKSRSKDGKKQLPGVAFGIVPYTYSGIPLDELREPFYKKEYEEREKKVALRPVIPRD